MEEAIRQDNAQFMESEHQKQLMMRKQQEEDLEEVSQGVTELNYMGHVIRDELKDQEE